MSEDFNELDEVKLPDLFLIENEESSFGRNYLWFNADEILPACVIDSKQIILTLGIHGLWQLEEDDKFYQNLKDVKVSKLILTFGRDESKTFDANYEIGFFDGERFRQLSGYAIYPPPSHWTMFSSPPKIKSSIPKYAENMTANVD